MLHRRQKHMDTTLARLHTQGGAHDPGGRLPQLWFSLRRWSGCRQRTGQGHALARLHPLFQDGGGKETIWDLPQPIRHRLQVVLAALRALWQGAPIRERIRWVHPGEVLLAHPRGGVQGQAEAHWRVPRHQVHALIPQEPRPTAPAQFPSHPLPLQWQGRSRSPYPDPD
jgi:hypothetical protein